MTSRDDDYRHEILDAIERAAKDSADASYVRRSRRLLLLHKAVKENLHFGLHPQQSELHAAVLLADAVRALVDGDL